MCFVCSRRPALLDVTESLIFSTSVHASVSGKLSEMHLGQQPLHSRPVTYFQLQVIKEPQRDHRKSFTEFPTSCCMDLLGLSFSCSHCELPECTFEGSISRSTCLPAALVPWLHSPSTDRRFGPHHALAPMAHTNAAEKGKSAYTEG